MIGFNRVERDGQCGVVEHGWWKSVLINRVGDGVVVSDTSQVPAVGESAGADVLELLGQDDCAKPAAGVEAVGTDALKLAGEVDFGE